MATKIIWLHLSIGIPLSPLTPFTYCLILTGLFPDMPNLIYLLSGIGFPALHCWKTHQPLSPAVILFCWDLVLLFRLLLHLFFHLLLHLLFYLMTVYYRNVVWMKSETPSNVAWAYLASGWMMRYSVTEDLGIVGTDLKLWGLNLKSRLEGIPDG